MVTKFMLEIPNRSRELILMDFRQLATPDFNASIRTSQAMIWYKGWLYVGTGRAPLGFMGRYTATAKSSSLNCEPSPSRRIYDAESGGRDEDGAQIWRFNPVMEDWELVFESPLVRGRDGKFRARDRSIRAAVVCQTEIDPEPTLYFGIGSLEGQVVFLRSIDGKNFDECLERGFGLSEADIPSVRTICGLNGKLYSTPTGKNYSRGMLDDNMTDYPVIFETADPLTGNWLPVSELGFDDPDNLSINEIAVFNNHLYAATLNTRRGFQLWKTDAEGKSPYRWNKILEDGAYRGPKNSIPASMIVFKDALYIGATLQRQGRKGLDRYGPFAAELIRVYSNDTWDVVCGTPRFTPQGLKRPISGMDGGFDDRFTHAFWRMTEYQDSLYVGTAGWKWMPTYLWDRKDLTETQRQSLQVETAKRVDGEFSLWRSSDGIHWESLTRTGFAGSNPLIYGVRELVKTPYGIFVAPTSKRGAISGGGLEIWWGSPGFGETNQQQNRT